MTTKITFDSEHAEKEFIDEKSYNPDYTWEYNLKQNVRWDTEDCSEDVIYYVKKWLSHIIKEEIITK